MTDTFQNRLKKAMEIRDMKAVDLAKSSGISKSRISQYVNGVYEAKQEAVYKLALALNVSEGWLMGYDVPMQRSAPADESDDVMELLDALRNRPEMRMLFSVSKDATREDIERAVAIIEALRKSEEDDE